MKVLVTGDKGYFGSVLVQELLSKGHEAFGLDIDYYEDCDLYFVDRTYPQIKKDIRDVTIGDVEGMEIVMHLAALSNDPLGELSPGLTEEINFEGTIRIAKLAKEAGVKRFIYSSSQSMYGISELDDELDEDKSEKNPLTSYAKTKWEAELALKKMATDDFTVICFRPSTIFGASPRLRCDIVYNNLLGSAYTTGKVEIKSDGSPWRPVIHVKDVSNAFIAGMEAPLPLVAGQSFNVGILDGNYTVKELAEMASSLVDGSTLTFTNEHGSDSRTYKVGFSKILNVLKDYYKPEWDLERGGKEILEMFKKIDFKEEQYRGKLTNRLQQISFLMKNKKIDNHLRRC